MTVFCLVETDDGAITDASLRALTLARELAAKGLAADGLAADANGSNGGPVLAAVVFGDPPTADLAAYGIPDVYAVSGIDGYAPQAWARALGGLLSPEPAPEMAGHAVVVAAGTDRGNEVLAHLGAITRLPMAANCTAAVDNGGALEITRQRWAGLLLEEAVFEEALFEAPVALLTVATDVVSPVPADELTAVAVHAVEPVLAEGDLAVRAVETSAGTGGASLATARVVIGGGRGVGSADGFAPLEELAALLGGVVGVSRVVTSEGWRPHTQQVGQTGTKITPDLYLACGISGAIQHIAGCSGAKNIIAINTDPDAPMMTRADYAVVGNLHEVIPALVAALRERAAP